MQIQTGKTTSYLVGLFADHQLMIEPSSKILMPTF